MKRTSKQEYEQRDEGHFNFLAVNEEAESGGK